MTLEMVRTICRKLPQVTEDIKWGHDLCFCIAGKMFAVVALERPHSLAFKCTPETFGELIERPGIIPAPYMARNMWVMEQQLGEALERSEVEALVRTSYDLVVSKLPRSKQPGAAKSAGKGAVEAKSASKGANRKRPVTKRKAGKKRPARRSKR
jgi:predicted DNA-binding protein (MmcQ/YjbR family)